MTPAFRLLRISALSSLASLAWPFSAGAGLRRSSPTRHCIALAVVLFVIGGAAFFAGGNVSPGVREDRGNRWVLIAFGAERGAGRMAAGLHGP